MRCLVLFACLALFGRAHAAEELRGLWVDTFHDGLRNEAEVQRLVTDARAAGFNALFVEVRRRGDAFYDGRLEPRAAEVAPGFDPLRRLLELAHDASRGPRLEVHAWVVAFNVWTSPIEQPIQPDHPFRRHPDWLTRNAAGQTWDGRNYALDPGHPAVQQHTFDVVMDLVRRYDLDGLHWDYIRYAGREWGYNEVAVRRFNTLQHRSGKPAATDPGWLQFRRDQVTALVRKVYLHVLAEKPALKVSAATITFAPGISNTVQWVTTAAYSDVLQDWRAWMEEGILDWNLPMTYFRQAEHADAFGLWNTFLKDHQYRRRAAPGLAFYLNSISNSLAQVAHARSPSFAGNRAMGWLAYSYAALGTNVAPAEVFAALAESVPASEPVSPPATPWKFSAASGHLKGVALRSLDDGPVDGAEVTLEGPVTRRLRTDATGFFGAVDLPPADYSVRVAAPGCEPLTADVTVVGGRVAHLEYRLDRTPANGR